MKRITLLILMFAFTAFSSLRAQDCFTFLPNKVGTKIESKHYDKKDKETATSTMTILTRTAEKLDIRLETKGAKADSATTQEYSYICKDGVMYIDMSSYLAEQLQNYPNMTLEVDAGKLELPTNLSEGQALKGGEVTVKILNNGFQIAKISVTISDRKVEKVETLKTTAGEYKCYKITQKSLTKIGFIKSKGSSAEWFAPGVGIVRSESYNKRGKLVSYTQVSKVY